MERNFKYLQLFAKIIEMTFYNDKTIKNNIVRNNLADKSYLKRLHFALNKNIISKYRFLYCRQQYL